MELKVSLLILLWCLKDLPIILDGIERHDLGHKQYYRMWIILDGIEREKIVDVTPFRILP